MQWLCFEMLHGVLLLSSTLVVNIYHFYEEILYLYRKYNVHKQQIFEVIGLNLSILSFDIVECQSNKQFLTKIFHLVQSVNSLLRDIFKYGKLQNYPSILQFFSKGKDFPSLLANI